jgi:hypothetical protein
MGYEERCIYHFLRAKGFATSRAVSTKICAMGLSVRFFKPTIPTGARVPQHSKRQALDNRQTPPGAMQDLWLDASWRSLKRRSRRRVALLQHLSEKCARQAF